MKKPVAYATGFAVRSLEQLFLVGVHERLVVRLSPTPHVVTILSYDHIESIIVF